MHIPNPLHAHHRLVGDGGGLGKKNTVRGSSGPTNQQLDDCWKKPS